VVKRQRAEYENIVRRVEPNLSLKKYKVYLVIRNIITIFISMVITKSNINQFIEGSSMDCYNKNITHIDFIPETITHLFCCNNGLKSLPKLPNGLIYLNCNNNRLTSLPKLPDGLISLYCNTNKLTELPKLPDGLKYLYCRYNELTELPKLPDGLKYLSCQYNNLPYEITIKNLKQHNKLIKRKQILSKICG
jgi:Leucine-rich repeat (LRR) protein